MVLKIVIFNITFCLTAVSTVIPFIQTSIVSFSAKQKRVEMTTREQMDSSLHLISQGYMY